MSDLAFELSQLDRVEHFPHLTEFEWEAIHRMVDKVGTLAVKSLLRNGDENAHRLAAQEFMAVELADARARASRTLAHPLKIDIERYCGDEKTPLRRWFCELDEAIAARQIFDEDQQVRYAMSQLAGKAKSWAYSLRSSDRECFPNLNDFKKKLQSTFEPPQSEFRIRAEFLGARQGSMDLHAYVQRMRYLASCVVGKPVDMSTQVTTFMTGLRDGPAKTQLFRSYPETLEEAFSIALNEDFNARQARGHGSRARPSLELSDPEPMDLSVVRQFNRSPRKGKCFRCLKFGHIARDCRASLPATDAQRRADGRKPSRDTSKNDEDQ